MWVNNYKGSKLIPPVQVRMPQMFCSGWAPTISQCVLWSDSFVTSCPQKERASLWHVKRISVAFWKPKNLYLHSVLPLWWRKLDSPTWEVNCIIYHSACLSLQRRSIACMLLFQGDNESGTTAATVKYMTFMVFFFGGLLVKIVRPWHTQNCLSRCLHSQRRLTIRSVEKKKKQIKTWTETPTPTTQDK